MPIYPNLLYTILNVFDQLKLFFVELCFSVFLLSLYRECGHADELMMLGINGVVFDSRSCSSHFFI